MLDVIRRRKGAVRIVLAFVVVAVAGSFALTIYGVWGGALSGTAQGEPNWIAVINGEKVPTNVFLRQRAAVERDLRDRFGDQVNQETLGSFVEQQALSSILGQYLAQQAAESEGVIVTSAEVSDSIVTMPNFQVNGRFVGVDQYRRTLRANQIDVSVFERDQARDIAADKLRQAIFALARVDDAEFEKRWRDEIERVDVEYVLLSDATYKDDRAPSASEIESYFRSHGSDYLTPEKRRSAYVLFDREAKAASMDVPESEIAAAYERDKATRYSHPEQRRASHILFRLEENAAPEKTAELRVKANDALARLRNGEDFGGLARQLSEDPGSAPGGGDLGYFGRGAMVKEFDDVVFSLPVGGTSDVFKSPFGFHIVRVAESRLAGVQTLDEVRTEIRRGLAVQKSQEEIRKAAEAFVTRLSAQEASFDKTASSMGYTAADTGLFGKGDPAGALGRLPQVDDAVFALSAGRSSAPIAVPQGLAVFSLLESRAPEPAPLESVRDRVETDLKKSRARNKARTIAASLLSASGSLADRATKQKLEIKSYPAVNRSQPLPPLTDASKSAAFSAAIGSVLGPFDADDGLVVLEVKGKSPATPDETASERASLRRRLLDEDRIALYQAFLNRLQKTAEIDVNESLLTRGRARG